MTSFPDPKPLPLSGSTTVKGSGAADVLAGYSGNDLLNGYDGNDVFDEGLHRFFQSSGGFVAGRSYDLGGGNDVIDGGTGIDLLSVAGTGTAGLLDLTAGRLVRGAQVDRFDNVEGFLLGEGADRVQGALAGVGLATGGGNDTIVGLSGKSVLDGGLGVDLLDLTDEAGPVYVYLDGSNNIWNGSKVSGIDWIIGAAGFENVLSGGSGSERFVGGAVNDVLYGYDGDDTLMGMAGNDSLAGYAGRNEAYGGAGDDKVFVGSGDLVLDGGLGIDTLNCLFRGPTALTLNLETGMGTGGVRFTAFEVYLGTRAVSSVITGSAQDETITGGSKADSLYGGEGDDALNGLRGVNLLDGGSGNDTIMAQKYAKDSLFGGADCVVDPGLGNDYVMSFGARVFGGRGRIR